MEPPEAPKRAQQVPSETGGTWSMRVGSLLGIPIRVHFTFVLLLLWFGTVSSGQGQGFLGGVVFMLLLFGCVVLHELGHATMARRFGVETREIVLYPIGGVARLERIPSGKAELLIALAGPAVNALLAGLLFGWLMVRQVRAPGSPMELLTDAPLVWQMLTANLTLFFFNLIPAFPMDGGRVLRALLAMSMDYVRATRIAATIGQMMAIVFVFVVVTGIFNNPLLLFVALVV